MTTAKLKRCSICKQTMPEREFESRHEYACLTCKNERNKPKNKGKFKRQIVKKKMCDGNFLLGAI